MTRFHWSLLTLLFTSTFSLAQNSNQETLKLKDVQTKKTFKENSEIKDIELKAEAGAKTRWSMKASLGYSGPSLAEPLSDHRRNPDGRFTDVRTSLGGSVGLRYRLKTDTTLNMGTGISAIRPFHGIEQIDTEDPYLSIDQTYKAAEVQWYSKAFASMTTYDFYRRVEQFGSVGFSQSGRYFIPNTQWTLGLNASLTFFLYERAYSKLHPHGASNYFAGIYPSLAYRLNEKWMLNTSSAFQAYNRRREKDWGLWELSNVTQRVGLGWGITREIYFSPYVTFFWKDPTWKTSTFAFSTIFSVF
ncbi:MAG: hypothetical protein KDD34_06020 [Bdellovibrionales bacterium]|nr:hypothetical protein [Bdellovibrionales bacterium]